MAKWLGKAKVAKKKEVNYKENILEIMNLELLKFSF